MPVEHPPQAEAPAASTGASPELSSPPVAASSPASPFPGEQTQPDRQQKPLKPTKPRRTSSRSIEAWSGSALMYWVFEVLLAVGMLLLAVILWRQDGLFTIRFIEAQVSSFKDASAWKQWLVPVFFTAGFLGAYPRKALRDKMNKALEAWHKTQHDDDADQYYALRKSIIKRFVAATFIQLVNMATSFSGLILTISGKTYEFFIPITIPKEGIGLLIPTFLIAGVLAFAPELITRWALPHLWSLLKRAWQITTNGTPTRVKA